MDDKKILFNIPANMYSSLSDSERYLLEYIYQHIEKISLMSIVTLSENANVSTATIVRLMKKIGYEGYTDFKYHLKERVALKDESNTMGTIENKIQKAIEKNKEEVNKTIEMLSIGNIEDAVQKIYDAQKIYVFARGFSEMIANEMTLKLQLGGKNCEMHNDPNIIRRKSQEIQDDELAVFISLSGETEELVEACKNLNMKKISTLSLLTRVESSLGELSDMSFIGYKGEHSYFPDYEVRSRLPLSVIARILLDAYMIRMLP
ncbi:MurR/RpiR family transcriptional regulator [Salibacterium aidingense]|uniref:MurR/RpiR family transcriptional regulator n=1 Tax=Salibacterium aidingense TaxID=384933 RepID=UPI00042852CE|nr:MurR/RpiR family transcriptional regulator [Salibacterium aidingense]